MIRTARRRRAHQAALPKTGVVAMRPGRLTAAGLALFAFAVLVLLVYATAAHASVWVVPAMSRAFPGTRPGTIQTIAIDAAGNEYQGVQVCLRGGGKHAATFSWLDGSDPLIVDNTRLHRVYYVNVTTPTTNLGSHRGLYPDPLVPRSFGEQLTLPGTTTPFYLLTHVPYGTPAGDYRAVLQVVNGGETVQIPYNLHVWGFGWSEISTHSAFSVSAQNLEASLHGKIKFEAEQKARILGNFYAMMHEHGLSPTIVHYLPEVSASGNPGTGKWASKVSPFLDPNGVNLQDNQLPWLSWFPWSRSKNPTTAQISTYLTEMMRLYKERGWHKKSYVYILDETMKTRAERKAEAYARLVHAASARSGYRFRFLLTDDPRPKNINSGKRANRFLFDDVDIWTPRYFYFFGRIPAIRAQQAAGKEVWWYTYTNASVKRIPSYVIDKPHIDGRAMSWIMEQWRVEGLLNWGFNRWGRPVSGAGWRDPYRYPLSLIKGHLRSNGCTSLVYPGYYPRYGLNDPYAAPVSSLRLEALRDGFEEREYMRIAKEYAGGGDLVKAQVKTVTQFPFKIQQANVFHFPVYARKTGPYDRARLAIANFIEAQPKQQ